MQYMSLSRQSALQLLGPNHIAPWLTRSCFRFAMNYELLGDTIMIGMVMRSGGHHAVVILYTPPPKHAYRCLRQLLCPAQIASQGSGPLSCVGMCVESRTSQRSSARKSLQARCRQRCCSQLKFCKRTTTLFLAAKLGATSHSCVLRQKAAALSKHLL